MHLILLKQLPFVTPAKAGVQSGCLGSMHWILLKQLPWMPAFAGMTNGAVRASHPGMTNGAGVMFKEQELSFLAPVVQGKSLCDISR
jgi:hypothetical protein